MNEPSIHLAGNLTADPDLRFTPTGRAVVHLVVAVNPRHRDTTGQWIEDTTSFWTCQAWGPVAENLVESVRKGDRVLIDGRIRASVWTPTEGDHAGTEQRRLDVVIDEIGLSVRFRPVTATRRAVSRTTTTSGHDAADAPVGAPPASEVAS